MTEANLRVYLLDRQNATRDLVASRLGTVDQVQVIGCSSDHEEARPELWRRQPDVVVLDQLPSLSGNHPFFRAANALGTGLVLHCGIPPYLSRSDLMATGVKEVVLKEIGNLERLVAAILGCGTRG